MKVSWKSVQPFPRTVVSFCGERKKNRKKTEKNICKTYAHPPHRRLRKKQDVAYVHWISHCGIMLTAYISCQKIRPEKCRVSAFRHSTAVMKVCDVLKPLLILCLRWFLLFEPQSTEVRPAVFSRLVFKFYEFSLGDFARLKANELEIRLTLQWCLIAFLRYQQTTLGSGKVSVKLMKDWHSNGWGLRRIMKIKIKLMS